MSPFEVKNGICIYEGIIYHTESERIKRSIMASDIKPDPVFTEEHINELAEILARGCLRLILSEGWNKRHKLLKELDNSRIASDELDNKLTAGKGRKKI